MKSISSTMISTILLTSAVYQISFSQVTWRASGEAGYFNSSGEGLSSKTDIQKRLEGWFKYDYRRDKQSASFQTRLKPELFGLKNQARSFRLKATGNYSHDFDKFQAGLSVGNSRYLFYRSDLNISYESFFLLGELATYLFTDVPAGLSFGYAYHSLSANEQVLDIIFFDTKLENYVSQYFKYGYGVYGEMFTVGSLVRRDYLLQKEKNTGWRIGPKVYANYIRDFVFNFEYRFLLHESQLTKFPSSEHWFRIVTGKIFSERWSIFLLADYYTRNFSLKNISVFDSNLLYTPMDLENRVYIKLGYEITELFELFLRSGYFNENLYKDNLSFAGWNVMIGVEVKVE